MFSISRRSQVFGAFVGLAIGFLIIFSGVFYFESNRNWENQKYKGLSSQIVDIENESHAEEFFSDIRIVTPSGEILKNEGIFSELPLNITENDRKITYQGLSLFVIGKTLSDGNKILFIDDITDAVEAQELLFENLLTSTLLLSVLVMLIGWLFTQRIFSPVRRIVDSIENFHLEQDSKKDSIPLLGKKNDEFVRIARNLESLYLRIRKETAKIEDLSSNIAHEIKNSLFGIASTLELALLQENPKQKIEQVHTQILHLGDVVQALLLLANKDINPEKKPVNIASLVAHYTREDSRISIIGSKKIIWNIHQELFEIAIGNIIGNAQKFTPKNGEIHISISKNQISISDTGVGIPAEKLPFVFDRFYKVDDMRTNGTGTGLGLTLSKHILEKLHGFSLSIRSTTHVGTELIISYTEKPTLILS